MADRPPSSPTRRRRSSREAAAVEAVDAVEAGAPGSARSLRGDPEARIAELEADLEAERRTVKVLLDRAERATNQPTTEAQIFDAAARMEALIAKRKREVDEQGALLKGENTQLRELTSSLDQMVRQQTRALVESEAQYRRKNAELERLNQTKAQFISVAAHELRTPLTSIIGYLELIDEGRFGDLPRQIERPLASLMRNSQRLKRLVDEMLDVSLIEAGKIQINKVKCPLLEVVRDVVADMAPLADRKAQTLSVEHEGVPMIDADPDKIHRVVVNLVSNSIRYTPEGGNIVVSVDAAPQDRFAGSWARLRVRDDGVGIPKALRHRIFEPFSVAHPVEYHTSSGPDAAGLGLYIARGIIEIHGGLITVESQVDVFTEFTVLLPLFERDSKSPG